MYPILEFDDSRDAIIEPSRIYKRLDAMPERCVFCFFQHVIQQVCGHLEPIHMLGSEIGPNPVYAIEHHGERIAVIHPGLGAPMAAAFLDETIALGASKFIACGGAGVLDKSIDMGHVIVPTSAIRDEGTSYHYLPPASEVEAHAGAVNAIKAVLDERGVPHDLGKTWTTDAIYRETREKAARRKAEGCLTVEMEAAAFFAVAQFRDVAFGQMLYGGDNLDAQEWDARGWQWNVPVRERLFWLSVDAVLKL